MQSFCIVTIRKPIAPGRPSLMCMHGSRPRADACGAGEAQKIDRIMEKFAERYCRDNPGAFGSADAAYLLAFALIMLNTDAHNPHADRKLGAQDFVAMCQVQVCGTRVPAPLGIHPVAITCTHACAAVQCRHAPHTAGTERMRLTQFEAQQALFDASKGFVPG